jgi:hypothetical protein
MISENLDDFLLDFGVSVKAGAISGLGILDINADFVLSGQVVNFEYALTCKASLFGRLSYLSGITVNGVPFEVKSEPLAIDDGSLVVVPLQRKTVIVPMDKTVAEVGGGDAFTVIEDIEIPQLMQEIDGGSASTVYIDGNELNGGAA